MTLREKKSFVVGLYKKKGIDIDRPDTLEIEIMDQYTQHQTQSLQERVNNQERTIEHYMEVNEKLQDRIKSLEDALSEARDVLVLCTLIDNSGQVKEAVKLVEKALNKDKE